MWAAALSNQEALGLCKYLLLPTPPPTQESNEDFPMNLNTHIRAARPRGEFNRKCLGGFNGGLLHLHQAKKVKATTNRGADDTNAVGANRQAREPSGHRPSCAGCGPVRGGSGRPAPEASCSETP